MTMFRDSSRGVVLIILASTAFGVCGPLAKSLISAGISPLQVTWLRVAGVSIVLLAASFPVWKDIRKIPVLPMVAYGLTAIAGVQACYFLAVSRLPVGIALLLEFTGPIIVVAWIRWVRRTRLPRPAVIGALLSIAGLAVVVEVWTGVQLDALGLLAGAGAAACQATYYLLGERLTKQVDIRLLLAVGFVVGTIALTPFAAIWSMKWRVLTDSAGLAGSQLPGFTLIIGLIACTAVAYAAGLPALRLLSAAVTGAMGYLEVVVASLAALVLLGEALTLPQMLGGLLVIAGVFTAQRAVAAPKVGDIDAVAEPTPIGAQR